MGPLTALTSSILANAWGTMPTEGLRPTIPQKEAGILSEPPRSPPVPSQTYSVQKPLLPVSRLQNVSRYN